MLKKVTSRALRFFIVSNAKREIWWNKEKSKSISCFRYQKTNIYISNRIWQHPFKSNSVCV